MTIIELIEKAKTRANIPSDYALAKAMRIERQIISQWRKGKRHPSIEETIQLATLAGLEEMPVIAQIEFQTATTEKKKHFWKCYLEQHGIAAALCMTATALSILMAPEPAQAGILQLQNYDAHYCAQKRTGKYIMRTRRRISSYGQLMLKAISHKFAACFFHVRPHVATAFS